MIGTIITVAVVWIIFAIILYPFFRKYIEEKMCGSLCSSCGDVTKCHVAMAVIPFVIAPFLPLIILWCFVIKPLSILASYHIRKFHTWEVGVVGKMTNSIEEKKEEKKKEREEKEVETIKSLKKKNKDLLKKVAELNKYGREEILDLEE